MIAALFVDGAGIYAHRADVDAWDEARDARKYAGPWAVVAHPPCERWGRYAAGGPNPRARRRIVGDDGGCFAAAISAVRLFGGVLEHPEASHAWAHFGLARPPRQGGWIPADACGWTCCVEQGHYGHRARKATWLYAVRTELPSLRWGRSTGARLDEGFHSREERAAARAAGVARIHRPTSAENAAAPPEVADLLMAIARSVRNKRPPAG